MRHARWFLALVVPFALPRPEVTVHPSAGRTGQAQSSAPALPDAVREVARAILKELIETNTAPSGSTRRAAERLAARLVDAGYPAADVVVAGPDGERKNLVVRLRGTGGGRPLLLLAHLDVVDARREDWSFDPFVLKEEGGWFYGRGTRDNKAGAAMLVANLLRWKREGWRPARDVIVLLTTDEETDAVAGIQWMLRNRRDLIDAEYCINTDAGDGELKAGTPYIFSVQASEKIYMDFRLEVRNRGGHSSLPRDDNAIYSLSAALSRLARYRFPITVGEVARSSMLRQASLERGQRAADLRAVAAGGATATAALSRLRGDPIEKWTLRTTCVATELQGGHAPNALPALAAATVNCRVLPGTRYEDLLSTLHRVLADTAVHIKAGYEWTPAPASPLRPDLMRALDSLARRHFPTATVMPGMSSGATDGLFLRNAGIPTYGVSALFDDPDDERSHGRDERVGVAAYYAATQFWYEMVGRLAR